MDKTRIYLDVSCLNRPFDDQSQVRIRLEAEAVVLILERFDVGVWRQVSSGIAVIEIDAIADEERRVNVGRFLPEIVERDCPEALARRSQYVVGKTADGKWAGLKTSVVET